MNITNTQQLLLIEEIKSLIDDNASNVAVLENAKKLAVIVFAVCNNNDKWQGVGFALQEYAFEKLEVAKGDLDAGTWIEHNDRILTNAIKTGLAQANHETKE